jgi:hypothetical protein
MICIITGSNSLQHKEKDDAITRNPILRHDIDILELKFKTSTNDELLSYHERDLKEVPAHLYIRIYHMAIFDVFPLPPCGCNIGMHMLDLGEAEHAYSRDVACIAPLQRQSAPQNALTEELDIGEKRQIKSVK